MADGDGIASAGRLQLEPFEPDSGSWTEWEERLQFFLESSGITSDSRKRATFLTVCGKNTYSLVRSLVSPQKPSEVSFNDLLQIIKDHQDPKPSVLVSRYKFGTCSRRPGQAVADYVAALRKASEHCCFDNTLEDRLLEQLVIGVGDERMQRRLLSEKSLDFSNAVRICLALETSSKDAQLMSHNGEKADTIQAVSADARRMPARTRCWRCTGDNHSADVCRFRNSKCYNCRGLGHVSKACPKPRRHAAGRGRPPAGGSSNRRRATNAVNTSDPEDWDSWPDEDGDHVQQVAAGSDGQQPASVLKVSSPPLRCSVRFQRTQVGMEIDTGSCNTLIGEDTYKSLQIRPALKPSTIRLKTYTGDLIPVLGQFRTRVTYKGQTHGNLKVVVVQGSRTNLMGRDWLKIVKLDWKEVCAVDNVSVEGLKRKYADVFEPGLGELKGVKLRLNIDRSVQPRFFRARSLPYAYREKIEKQLQKDVEAGVLEPVTHSSWAAPLVPVLKKDGTVRVCANFKLTANRAVKCDTYPLPLAQDIFARLAGGKIFSTLDLAQAYNQVVVHEDSRDVLTVNTPKGLMRYSRLPFGINSAVSLFQREIEQVLGDVPGVVAYLDDILISSRTTEEHLKTLDEVLGRLQRAGLKVRPAKCRFLVPTVGYLGHIVDKRGIRPTPAKVRAIQSAPEPQDVKQLKAFLGILTYYSRYIPDRSHKLAPLHVLPCKRTYHGAGVQSRLPASSGHVTSSRQTRCWVTSTSTKGKSWCATPPLWESVLFWLR